MLADEPDDQCYYHNSDELVRDIEQRQFLAAPSQSAVCWMQLEIRDGDFLHLH